MKAEELFKTGVTQKIWNQYAERLRYLLRKLETNEKDELLLEIQSHLLESFRQNPAESEEERLLDAIHRLGEPEIFLKPMIADTYMDRASRTLSPRDVFKGLYFTFLSGFKKSLISLTLGLGYAFVVVFLVLAILKPFFPDHIGLLLFNDGTMTAGMALDTTGVKVDYLGYWFIPIAIGLSSLIYIGLTRWLRMIRRTKPEYKGRA